MNMRMKMMEAGKSGFRSKYSDFRNGGSSLMCIFFMPCIRGKIAVRGKKAAGGRNSVRRRDIACGEKREEKRL